MVKRKSTNLAHATAEHLRSLQKLGQLGSRENEKNVAVEMQLMPRIGGVTALLVPRVGIKGMAHK
jgi:hypothetical protein